MYVVMVTGRSDWLVVAIEFLFSSLSLRQIESISMDTDTFSLDEIRRELARLGYHGLSKQTLLKFQQDLAEIAQEEKAQSRRRRMTQIW